MEVHTRNKLAEIMFDIKKDIPEGKYLEFMNILGKKETEPNIEDITMVKLFYTRCQYIHLLNVLDIHEYDHLKFEEMADDFTLDRMNIKTETKIVEVYGNPQYQGCEINLSDDLHHSRIHVRSLQTFMTLAKGLKNIKEEAVIEHPYMIIMDEHKHQEWFQPIDYTIIAKKTPN